MDGGSLYPNAWKHSVCIAESVRLLVVLSLQVNGINCNS